MKKRITFLALLVVFVNSFIISVGVGESYFPAQAPSGEFEGFAQGFLQEHCLDCHDNETAKGNLSLEDLGSVDETNAGIWKSIWAQLALQEMPPPKKSRLQIVERLRFSDWVVNQLQHTMKNKGGFEAHRDPSKANFINHDLLFGDLPDDIHLTPSSSPARIWRLTPQEYITRLNELINTEPQFDPKKPGLRARGDVVPTNHGGELKLYFGTDRIIKWQGGTVAYATSVKSIPAVLSSNRKRGFKNYPNFYSINSAESNQILAKAESILRYMAFGPLSIANPEQITDDPKTYKTVGDLRGLPTALVYSTKIVRPLTPVYDLMKKPDCPDDRLKSAVDYLFEALTFRPPTESESRDYISLVEDTIKELGKEQGVIMGLSAIFLDRDALFRPELADGGRPDNYGRVMLQDWELGLAVNHALRYIKPDTTLRRAILDGRMKSREDVKREVLRILDDDTIRKPRILRFFRDYFDYDLAGYICKDDGALASAGISARGNSHYRAMFDAVASTDRLIELILKEDKNVLRELLTTQKVVATDNDKTYFGRKNSPQEKRDAIIQRKKDQEAAKKKDIDNRDLLSVEIAKLESEINKSPGQPRLKKTLDQKKRQLSAIEKRLKRSNSKRGNNTNVDVKLADLNGSKIYARVSRRSFGNGSMRPERILATAPAEQRMGVLTHPAWLVSHSDAMGNHAIHRGKWIRERLLGGGIPDVPITVDAMLPDEPGTTLRHRMRVTREEYCWTCHEKMDPLGLAFEIYNHAGIFRTTELGKPVISTGEIIDSGDPELDGPVKDAIEMIEKLASSKRVEQVFVRHAFRFWMGRNETLNDAPILQAAHKAYRDSGGSFRALLVSLLTSDAFIFRQVGN